MPRKPIELRSGRKLVTLKDAATYITGLPKKESALPEWQTATEVLMLCSRGGAHRRHESSASQRGAGVQHRSKRDALG